MKKEEKFLKKINYELEKNNIKEKDDIVLKYKNIIDERLINKEKLPSILKDLGNPIEIANKEIELLKKNKKDIKEIINNILNNMSKYIKIFINKLKPILNKLKIFLRKVKDFIIKYYKILSKDLFEKNKDFQIEDNTEEIEIVEEVEKKNVLYVTKPLTKEERRRKDTIKILGIILISIITFIWLWSCVITIASIVALLDGVKTYGLTLSFIGISTIILWLDLLLINSIYKKLDLFKYKLLVLFISIFTISLGIALSLIQYFKLEEVTEVNTKFSMTKKIDKYNLSSNTNEKMYLIFNSEYKTQYVVNYDETLDGEFKVEVDYYEALYDYYTTKSSNTIYFSLKKDFRDVLSTYIDSLKDNKIYSEEELTRYIVKITISKKDYKRLVIEN